MKSEDYDIVPLDTTKLDDFIRLNAVAFAQAPLGVDYLNWKYRDNPAGLAVGCFARHRKTGEYAAYFGMIPEMYRWGRRTGRVYQACDVATHPAHRRKNLFLTLTVDLLETVQKQEPGLFVMGFGGPTTTSGYRKVAWKTPFNIDFLFQPRLVSRARGLLSSPEGAAEYRQAPSEMIAMMQENAASRRSSKIYDDEFLRWRLANPRRDYRFIVDSRGAYAIYGCEPHYLTLMEFWERERGLGGGVMALLAHRAVEQRGKGVLSFSQAGTPYAGLLRRHGFFRNGFFMGPGSQSSPFVAYGAPRADPDLFLPESWQIGPLDHDSY